MLGVLIINLHFWFRAPMLRYQLEPHPWGGVWNVGTDWFLKLFLEGKAMSNFAMLFAVGLAIQMERVEGRGLSFWKFGIRRLTALFLFGILHLVLVWNGDILHNYALVGFLCLIFLNRKLQTVKIWFGMMCGLAITTILVLSIRAFHGTGIKPPSEEAIAKLQASIQETIQNRGHGTWLVEFKFRLREWVSLYWPGADIFYCLGIFILFLAGLAIWKSGMLRDPSAFLPRIRKFFYWAFPLGIFMGLVDLLKKEQLDIFTTHWKQIRFFLPLIGFSSFFGPVVMALAWASGALLLLQKPRWSNLLEPFSYVGRMALTNYLAQSVVMTFLFFGWGLRLYNKLGPLAGLAVSLTFYTLQVGFSQWWLARFQYGPMEWAWRCITYWKVQPLRLSQNQPPEATGPACESA